MAEHVCPSWVAYFLLNPLRRLLENPDKMLGPFVQKGMVVLEPGPAMGFFTLPLARMVGPTGRVVAVDVQQRMLRVLERRARKQGLFDRIDPRLIEGDGLGVSDLDGTVDFAVAIHMVHEVPDQAIFFNDVFSALKPRGKLFVVEPKGHVSQNQFGITVAAAERAGFVCNALPGKVRGRTALLCKSE